MSLAPPAQRTSIHYRPGAAQDLARLVGPGERRILLVADPALRSLGLLGRLLTSLEDAGHLVDVHEPPAGEPSLADVDLACLRRRAHGADLIVGVGGGSTLDTAKLVACLGECDGPIERFACGQRPLPPRTVDLICLPTTAGTGAEVTGVAVLSNALGKIWVAGPALRPDHAVLDPLLTVTLPPAATVATAIDALVHAIEAATNRNAHGAATRYCLTAIRLVRRALPRVLAEPTDMRARGDLMRAAAAAGIGIDRAGTGIAHCIGHALASAGPIAHGRAVGLGMAASLAWCAAVNQAAYARVADALDGPGDADHVAGLFAAIARRAGLQPDLGEGFARVGAAELAERMAEPANAPMRAANARAPSAEDLGRFARVLLAGRALG